MWRVERINEAGEHQGWLQRRVYHCGILITVPWEGHTEVEAQEKMIEHAQTRRALDNVGPDTRWRVVLYRPGEAV